jgi:serine/threonine-protein kinase haspin
MLRLRSEYFDEAQLYALVVLGDGGRDLESFKFDKPIAWLQASGIFWQVVGALALAEEACSFEVSELESYPRILGWLT